MHHKILTRVVDVAFVQLRQHRQISEADNETAESSRQRHPLPVCHWGRGGVDGA